MNRQHRRVSGSLTALAALLGLAALTVGCTGGTEGSPAAGPSVIAPGAPGERAHTLSPQEAEAQGRKERQPNSADIDYMSRMVVHHEQALVMADLAPERAGGAPVRKLADRIRAAQDPEITAMRAWLERHAPDRAEESGSDASGHGHSHGDMPGMATEEELAELRAAEGAAFDALFLELMIDHHNGAVTMVAEVLGAGNDVRVEELAADTAAQQSAEVERMRAMRG
ncbi:DUF305 domain-containing protein [Streptomyces chumphonensis]|uniref:DUF305 domain-containing protein n=1 Tax=Streptomyces chumphonensis TaxID=1214925 RepID=A0A927EW53_9ACTN|nr:DUF305 domain-containing protein [Streptomyces chumphonensis]MBD3931060.1 DUF305 domain-containing protein [Streptomyces chumphonensis]